ncbi:uncharacterized protein [Clytia hemisphaerica]|uniref:Uncharacterized protein n=1 Tax=Clytia hemisphaerica TaxID=252671 RepID=A0A7M5XHQ6_9CNID
MNSYVDSANSSSLENSMDVKDFQGSQTSLSPFRQHSILVQEEAIHLGNESLYKNTWQELNTLIHNLISYDENFRLSTEDHELRIEEDSEGVHRMTDVEDLQEAYCFLRLRYMELDECRTHYEEILQLLTQYTDHLIQNGLSFLTPIQGEILSSLAKTFVRSSELVEDFDVCVKTVKEDFEEIDSAVEESSDIEYLKASYQYLKGSFAELEKNMSFHELQSQLYKDHLEYKGLDETSVCSDDEQSSRTSIEDYDDSLSLEGDEELERLLSGENADVHREASELPVILEGFEGGRTDSPQQIEQNIGQSPKPSVISEEDGNASTMSTIREKTSHSKELVKTTSNKLGSGSRVQEESTRGRKTRPRKTKSVNHRKRSVCPQRASKDSKSDSEQKKSPQKIKSVKKRKLISIDNFEPSRLSTKISFSAKNSKLITHEHNAEEEKKSLNIPSNEEKPTRGKLLPQRPTKKVKYLPQDFPKKTTLKDLNDQKLSSQSKILPSIVTLQENQNITTNPPKQQTNQYKMLSKRLQINKPTLKRVPRPPTNTPIKKIQTTQKHQVKETTSFLPTPPSPKSTHKTSFQRKRVSFAPPQSLFNIYKQPLINLTYSPRNH